MDSDDRTKELPNKDAPYQVFSYNLTDFLSPDQEILKADPVFAEYNLLH